MEKILKELPKDIRESLLEIKKQDKEVYNLVLKKIIRLRIIVKSGNVKAWNKIKKEEAEIFNLLLEEINKDNKIEELKRRINSI